MQNLLVFYPATKGKEAKLVSKVTVREMRVGISKGKRPIIELLYSLNDLDTIAKVVEEMEKRDIVPLVYIETDTVVIDITVLFWVKPVTQRFFRELFPRFLGIGEVIVPQKPALRIRAEGRFIIDEGVKDFYPLVKTRKDLYYLHISQWVGRGRKGPSPLLYVEAPFTAGAPPLLET